MSFHPHIVGFGHRIRCNLIAEEIKKMEPQTKIVFLDRRDDPLFRENWTPYKRVHGGVRRSISLFTSSCLVEDCAMIEDFRRKWYSKVGRIVTILNPTFRPEFVNQKHHLKQTDLIAICYPKGLFPLPEMIQEFEEKITWFGPVLNLPGENFQLTASGVMKINILASRGKERIVPLIHALSKDLGFEIIQTEFKSAEDHFSSLSETSIAITQGTTGVFECSHLGIPQICLPINYEQLVVAKKFEEAGALKRIPVENVTKENLREALDEMISDRNLGEEMVEKAKKFASPPGTTDIARAVIEIVKGTE